MSSKSKFGQLMLLALVAGSLSAPVSDTNCNGKDFICPDENSFLTCVKDEDGQSRIADGSPQNCPSGYYCDNSLESACSSVVPPSSLLARESEGETSQVQEENEETQVVEEESETVVHEESASENQEETQESTQESGTETMVNQEESETVVDQEELETVVNQEESETEVNHEETETVVNQEESEIVVNQEGSETVVNQEESETVVNQEESETEVNQEETDTNSESPAPTENNNEEAANDGSEQPEESTSGNEETNEDESTQSAQNGEGETDGSGSEVTEGSLDSGSDSTTIESPPDNSGNQENPQEGESNTEIPSEGENPQEGGSEGENQEGGNTEVPTDGENPQEGGSGGNPEVPSEGENQEPTPAVPFECSSMGKFADPNDCHKYIMCIWTPFGYLKFENVCPLEEAYDAIGQQCSEDLTLCGVDGKPATENHPFECIERGKFADPSSNKKYYVCVVNPISGNFLKVSLNCPLLMVFNETAQKCTSELFPGDVPTVETNDQDQSGSQAENNGSPQNEGGTGCVTQELFVCTEEGTFADPADTNYYYICKLKKKNKFKLKHKKCGKNKIFNPETLMCDPVLVAVEEPVSVESEESKEN